MQAVHMLFAPTGLLKIRSDKYLRIHASLIESYRASKSARLSKRQRAQMRKRVCKQTGELINTAE